MKRPKIQITLIDQKGTHGCHRGHKIGDTYDFDTERGKLCPMAMHVAFPYVDILRYGGEIPNQEKGTAVFACPDVDTLNVFKIERIEEEENDKPEVTCFYAPNEENGYLSNWYPSQFTVDDVKFSSMEQFMMYGKAVCFHDDAVKVQILNTHDVAEIKKLGRSVSNYNDNVWNGVRQLVVYTGLKAKFTQNAELKEKLKATGETTLAECAGKDYIWGIGLSMDDPNRFDRSKWKGQNLLGYTLMTVRADILRRDL